MQFVWCLVLVFILPINSQAGLFDSVASQVTQVVSQAQRQQQAQQQQAQQQAQEAQRQSQQQAQQQQSAQQQVQQQQAQQQAQAVEDTGLKAFWAQEQPRLDALIQQGEILKVKGFYPGMNIDDACSILNQKVGLSDNVRRIQNEIIPLTGTTIEDAYGCFTSTGSGIYSNNKKQVSTFEFFPNEVDVIFNSNGIPADDFAKKFIDAYKISEMKPMILGNHTGWQYVSSNGYKITILDDKTLTIELVSKPSEMKFD